MDSKIKIKKALNNNVVIASHPQYTEIVLIGKGIGFNRAKGETITLEEAEKTFLLKDQDEVAQYLDIARGVDEQFIEMMHEIIHFIESEMDAKVNEHIHVGLTDHIAFAMHRIKHDMDFSNPFLLEIETLYPKAYRVAEKIVAKIEARYAVDFPIGEVGFVTLHIHSAISHQPLKNINQNHRLIKKIVQIVEEAFEKELADYKVDYRRFLQHLHRILDRVHRKEGVGKQENLKNMLKSTYPECYTLAYKLIKVIQRELQIEVDDDEVMYLTIHLQRLKNSI